VTVALAQLELATGLPLAGVPGIDVVFFSGDSKTVVAAAAAAAKACAQRSLEAGSTWQIRGFPWVGSLTD